MSRTKPDLFKGEAIFLPYAIISLKEGLFFLEPSIFSTEDLHSFPAGSLAIRASNNGKKT